MKVIEKVIIMSLLNVAVLYGAVVNAAKIENPKDLITCAGKYALCSQTQCAVSKDGKTATCNCPVNVGKNLGGTSCQERDAALKFGYVYSDYSPIHLLGEDKADSKVATKLFDPGYMCKNDSSKKNSLRYADCFDIKCSFNGSNHAICSCPIYKTYGPGIMIESGSCDKSQALCDMVVNSTNPKVVVNSSPTLFGLSVIEESLHDIYNKRLTPSMICQFQG
jgi:hypothetical protein